MLDKDFVVAADCGRMQLVAAIVDSHPIYRIKTTCQGVVFFVGVLKHQQEISYPYHPWDWYIYLHIWFIFMVNVGKYTIVPWMV